MLSQLAGCVVACVANLVTILSDNWRLKEVLPTGKERCAVCDSVVGLVLQFLKDKVSQLFLK